MWEAVEVASEKYRDDTAIRTLILPGAGRKAFRMLNIIDEFARESLAIHVRR